ncbi:MAG TPA: MjaI family restriction endonuclease [Candidatus Bathyarchaeia archaeon]|nr:MjaI family restriction endonuclease [Candidatus Bathyarchaeia archaeon]
MEIILKNDKIAQDVVGKTVEFPKYTTQIMNLANQNAQGTRPKVVGQMSELIKQFPNKTYEEWVKWYNEQMPNAIAEATEKVYAMVKTIGGAISAIDKNMVRKWVEDLVLTKTFIGFCFQESILKAISETKGVKYRVARPQEESKGIDGFIGEMPVSIKPITYKTMSRLQENIEVKIIYYEKLKDGIKVEYDF